MPISFDPSSLLTFFLKRHLPPFRKLELIEADCKPCGTSPKGELCHRMLPLVHYRGEGLTPGNKVRWIPCKKADRKTLSACTHREYRETDLVLNDSEGNAWPKGLRMDEGDTFRPDIYLAFPPDVWKVWRGREVQGRVLIQYGTKRSLSFDHAIKF